VTEATSGKNGVIALKVIIILIFHTVTSSLGEEIGWRGYLLPHLMPLGWKKAVVLTGFIHAVFHIPLMMAGLYHSEGNPIIIYPLMIIQTINHHLSINDYSNHNWRDPFGVCKTENEQRLASSHFAWCTQWVLGSI
jgi:predicted Abi (CAAX) family protease